MAAYCMVLSKSDYMLYLRHPAWLWLKKHAKHLLPPVDAALQARFDEGHEFEPYAESLFPGVVRLGFSDFSSYQALPDETLRTWQNGANVVAQGRYEDGQITCISDVVSRNGDGFVLTEIKSGTSAKPEHTFDLAFQRVVLEAAGFPITRCEVAHVNREYVRDGAIDPAQLVAITDITEAVEEQLESTRARIDHALSVAASGTMPDPAPERARLNSYDEWLTIREALDPPLADNSIHRLPFMSADKATKLIETGITEIGQIEDASILGKSTRRYLSALAQGGRRVDKVRLDRFLGDIVYPVHYFDYETSQSLLPPWDGTRPYQQVPFQYSLHIQHEPGGEIEHREYLHRDGSNPMPALLERLREDVGDTGSVLVWYEGFEKARNNEMVAAFPEYAAFLDDLNERVIDLMKPFADETITDPAFKGSASIKAVLPVLVPELTYSDLGIQEGGSASRLWKEVTLTNPEAAEREKVYADLVEYCTLDTWAMVAIHKTLLAM
ncbi:DUF2779 domain-containing protein [Ruegeria arenilitoris]|uniref:DUF2779 domain-containing protein n=1 Tax=Ruegeria arenilitoris TaxID=1173585 RepID=UPI00147D710A|nr:DUF2779 domain-containing protein [Ruegeria arenilitoris]